MLFHDNVFASEDWDDPCTLGVLCKAAERAGATIEPGHLLAAVILENDPAIQDLLSQSLRPSTAINDLYALALRRLPDTANARQPKTHAAFSPTALQALDIYKKAHREQATDVSGRELEILLLTILLWLSPEERQEWNVLDAITMARILEDRRSGKKRAKPAQLQKPSQESPDDLPAELAPAEDLTQRVRQLGSNHVSPFSDDPSFEHLFDQLARGLHRSEGHVLLIGERGSGQSIILTELANHAAQGRLATLGNKRLILIDCRHTPLEHSQHRLESILSAVGPYEDWIVCLDGFASLLRSERRTSNKTALLAILPQLQATILGVITPREFEELFADDADLRDRFAVVEVPELARDTAIRLMNFYAAGIEARYQVQIDTEAVQQAVMLTADYILHECLPGKAIRVLRQACEDVIYEWAQYGHQKNCVTADGVIRAVAQISGIPEETLRGVAERNDYKEHLSQEIFGQEFALREVAAELGLIKAGLIDPEKPASVMLFVGQTGTGKTEMAKAMANFYSRSKRLRTYTLGNFVEPHSVASIIGVPPGYVGHEQGGRIVTDLSSDPYCVFLLDEADKAHPDVLQPFLNLFDEGWVCDQRGVKAYADKAIFILTTNVGQRMLADMARQGKTVEEMTVRMKEALSQIRHGKSNRPVFAPEFLARIRRIIIFQPLSRDAMQGICRKLLHKMQATWRDKRRKNLIVPESLIDYISQEAHQRNEKTHGREGGRLVRKLISEWVERPIQRAATAQPDTYRSCDVVALAVSLPEAAEDDQQPAPKVTVQFQEATVIQQSAGEESEHVG